MNATTVLESKPFGSDGVVITKGYCTPPDSDSDSGTALRPISVLTFCIDICMPAVNLAASPASRPTCVTALNDCVARFGGLFQGNGWVSKCGAPCFSVCLYTKRPTPFLPPYPHILTPLFTRARHAILDPTDPTPLTASLFSTR
jgi:hypothetical protein